MEQHVLDLRPDIAERDPEMRQLGCGERVVDVGHRQMADQAE